MSLILSNLVLGMTQALLLTFLAPLLAGLILQAGGALRQMTQGTAWSSQAEQSAVRSVTIAEIYALLGRAWARSGAEDSSRSAFLCTFLASSMLPGFLGAKISFGDSFIMLLLFGAGLFLTRIRGRMILIALFLLLTGAGFQHRGSMALDLVFSFQGYYLTGAAFLAAAGAFCTVIWYLAGLWEHLSGSKETAGDGAGGKAPDLWLLLSCFLQAVFLLIIFAQFFLPVELPSGPGVILSAVMCALVLGLEGGFHAGRRIVWSGAAVLFAVLSLLAR